ncbi:ABC transporter substrate-binding protein [Porcipelethomonas sp.]|uniref:ABC transporter substrate-binding protein n=1 Tax=Porcipelethomonas sp. TaxID=2981675 RepID=UPI003EF8DFCC
MKLKRFLTVLAAMTMLMTAFTACNGDSSSNSESESSESSEAQTQEESAEDSDVSGQTIYWLSDYDLNPYGNEDRSIALTLFEDVYGGKIEWVPTTPETKYDDLANRILGGEPVDMIDYEPAAFPGGIADQYQPLDDYIDLNDELWADTKELADSMAYQDKHYIVPVGVDDPVCLIYSRKMMKDEDLDDPYELYKKGEWNWDAFVSMMKKFTENGDDRYGCTGWIGSPVVQSSGQPFVAYDGKTFTSNIMSTEIEKAENVLEEIGKEGLYNASWNGYFPDDGSTLFYGMTLENLAQSNAKNEDEDIFFVPFPKMPDSDKYYLTADISAKMLAANSDKGKAVAEYITCEKVARTEEKYKAAAKEKALVPEADYGDDKGKYITEEQYDFWQELLNPENITPVFDYGCGMGTRMYSETYDYSTRGVINNLSDALISEYEGSPSSWEELRDKWKDTIDKEIKNYN